MYTIHAVACLHPTYLEVRIHKGGVGETITKVEHWLGLHVAVGPAGHAVVGEAGQLAVVCVPRDGEPASWIVGPRQDVEDGITGLCESVKTTVCTFDTS